MSWLDAAECRTVDPKWFQEPGASVTEHSVEEHEARARAICDRCPVYVQCRAYALTKVPGNDTGIWAGMLPKQRRRARRLRLAEAAC